MNDLSRRERLESAAAHAPGFRIVPALDVPDAELHQAYLDAFSDYLIGPFQVALAQWSAFLARQDADLALSRVAVTADGRPLAFALVATRSWQAHWRLASMGARPEARGSGAAPALLDDFIARATAGRQTAVELEVFAQNERARRLYESRGFEAVRNLYGYELALGELAVATPAAAPIAPLVVDLPTALTWLDAAERRWPDLPMQIARASVQYLTNVHAWQLGDAQLLFTLPDDQVVAINSLVAPSEEHAQALIQALARAHPRRRLRLPQIQREDLGGAALRALGATPMPLHQRWMRRDLRNN